MAVVSIDDALSFVQALEISAPPVLDLEEIEAAPAPSFAFDAAKAQAAVVGSDIIGFVKGVTPERRADIVRSSLLAQLAATKKVPNGTDVYAWYEAYFDVLQHVGWVIQDRGFATYSESSQDFEAHQAILKVAASLLGASAALEVVTATLNALKSMSADSPWIRLFNRESQSARLGRFQVTLAEQGPQDDFLVSLMAFGLEAKSNLTQILFVKFHTNDVILKHYSGKITVDATVLAGVRDAIAAKITAFAADYVHALPDL